MEDATKNRSIEELISSERKVKRLSNEIAEGVVLQIILEKSEQVTRGILLLFADSAIREHTHVDDWEEYIFSNGVVLVCERGKSHSLKNETGELLVVFFIKHRE